jgi:hypothetical protein
MPDAAKKSLCRCLYTGTQRSRPYPRSGLRIKKPAQRPVMREAPHGIRDLDGVRNSIAIQLLITLAMLPLSNMTGSDE